MADNPTNPTTEPTKPRLSATMNLTLGDKPDVHFLADFDTGQRGWGVGVPGLTHLNITGTPEQLRAFGSACIAASYEVPKTKDWNAA